MFFLYSVKINLKNFLCFTTPTSKFLLEKIFYIFSGKKAIFSYISGNRTFLKKLFIFQEGTFRARKVKKNPSEKISYI